MTPCCCNYQAWSVGEGRNTDLWYSCLTSKDGYHCKPAIDEGQSVQTDRSNELSSCFYGKCDGFFCFSVRLVDWIQAVQALMILSVLFCFFSLIAFLFQLFKLVKGGRFFFTAIFQVFASKYDFITWSHGHTQNWSGWSSGDIICIPSKFLNPPLPLAPSSCSCSFSLSPLGVFVMCAAIIYTVMSPDDSAHTQFGYAYVLAWVAFPLTLISGLIYIILRKKDWEEKAREERGRGSYPLPQHRTVPTAHRPETDITTLQHKCPRH